jgi:beta-phosphoglucomutase
MSQLAVIFDVDGVLVDSYDAHFKGWQRLFHELGREYSETEFAAGFGRTSREILSEMLGSEVTDEQILTLDARKEAYYRDAMRRDFRPIDGAVELIDALARAGFRLAVGSSGPPENVDLALDNLSGTDRIAAVVTGRDVTRGKPDPQIFQLAAERLQVPGSHCAVVEDAVHGIEAAKRAGMAAIALVGTATRTELAAADLVVDSLRELSPSTMEALIRRRDK